jgi:putative ABC transport system permease protein
MVTTGDIRNAVRGLLRSPTTTVCAILCLGLGIGATTAISSALSRALLQPLPFREPERLVAVHRITPQSGPLGRWSQSVANYVDLRDRSRRIEGLAAVTWGSAIVNLPDESFHLSALRVSGNFFTTLGATAQRGRLILPEDDAEGAPWTAVMSDELWRTRFGGDAAVVGRTLAVNGQPTTIVGIAPRDFRVPIGSNSLRAELWLPQRFTPDQRAARNSNYLLTFGRLVGDATVEAAEAELRSIFVNIVAENPRLQGDNVRVAPLHAESVQNVRKPLILLFAAVVAVLLIAATNVAALLLARGVQRQREMAVRAALGASRWDSMRPALMESAVLTAVGVLLGVGLASAGVKTIGLLAAANVPQVAGLRLNGAVLAFALVLSIVVAAVCAAAPAWRSTLVDPQDALRGGRGGGMGRSHQRALRSLVVLEISLSLVLLIGAGLVLKGFASLLGKNPGFDAERVLTLRISSSATRSPNNAGVRDFVEPVIAAMAAVPGVEAAAAISATPYMVWGNNRGVRYEGQPDEPGRRPIVEQRSVTLGFFDVTKQRLIAGRLLTPNDNELPNSAPVVVVNEALVKRDLRGQNPIGKRWHTGDTTFATIVGVVSDIKNAGPVADPAPEMYWNYRQSGSGTTTTDVMVRVRAGDPAAVAPGLRQAVRGVDPTAAVANVVPMSDVIARSLGSPRFYFSLLGTFAGIALVLAIAGLYGVVSYAVAQRTRELGIRSALGSSTARIVRLIAVEGFQLVAIGIVLGLAGGAAVTRLMTFMLYGVSPLDPMTWTLAAVAMLIVAMSAALIPARRAARVNPMVAIQSD